LMGAEEIGEFQLPAAGEKACPGYHRASHGRTALSLQKDLKAPRSRFR
jgi:hypothetical protein